MNSHINLEEIYSIPTSIPLDLSTLFKYVERSVELECWYSNLDFF